MGLEAKPHTPPAVVAARGTVSPVSATVASILSLVLDPAGVIGSLDLLKRQLAAGKLDRADRYIDAAATSAQRAAGLTHRLLAFSRRQMLQPEALRLNEFVAQVVDMLQRTLGGEVSVVTYRGGEPWANATVSTAGEAAGIKLSADRAAIRADGLDLSCLRTWMCAYDANVRPR